MIWLMSYNHINKCFIHTQIHKNALLTAKWPIEEEYFDHGIQLHLTSVELCVRKTDTFQTIGLWCKWFIHSTKTLPIGLNLIDYKTKKDGLLVYLK